MSVQFLRDIYYLFTENPLTTRTMRAIMYLLEQYGLITKAKELQMSGLKQKRKEQKMSRKVLANILGVSEKSIYFYEIGQREPNIATLKRLAELFKCSIEELL